MPQSKTLAVGTAKRLLFDDALVEAKEGFTTTMNPATRTQYAPCWHLKSRGSRAAVIIPV